MIPDVGPSQGKTILVVEDDEAIRETLQLFLELEGYVVFTANNGKVGLEILQKSPHPCLILLDLMMPVMNGWEFVEATQKDDALASIPVVIVTAYGDQVAAVKAKDVVRKPIDLEALLKIVQSWCGLPGKAQT